MTSELTELVVCALMAGAMMWASCKGDLEIVKFLVESGADVNAKDNEGWNSLMEASYEGHLKVIKYLIENGKVNVNAKDDDGWTALIRLCLYNNIGGVVRVSSKSRSMYRCF